MFSSAFEKVVSATAPDVLATFPTRATLPASASTICCLAFADRFLSHYPITHKTAIGSSGDHIDVRLASHVGTGGIAISADDLESIMQSAAELGGRLSTAMAGTARSQKRGPVAAPVSDLLTKVRGIFGNRLSCIGREIRVSRDFKAERDETLLLRQIHALKNAALDACNGEKWCVVVSSGEESLVVCSIPLPPVEDGGACGCDFCVFDPSPRPDMKLRGSYIIKFTTVRGLQLHLLSALGEVWREEGLPKEDGVGKGFVGLSVVMEAQAGEPGPGEWEARSVLEESVTRLRKAEKATAIKKKREEVEALRKALAGSDKQHPTAVAPVPRGGLELTGSKSRRQGIENDTSCAGSTLSSNGRSHFRRQETHYEGVEIADGHLRRRMDADGDNIKSSVLEADAVMTNSAPGTARVSSDSAVSRDRSDGGQALSDHLSLANSCSSPCNRLPLQPPVADISPPLSVNRSEREERRRWFEGDRKDPLDKRDGREPGVATETATEEASATDPGGEREGALLTSESEINSRTELAEQGNQEGGASGRIFPPNLAIKPAIAGDALHRALLRSVEGEGLVEYSKRAYNVYRAYGVIQDGVLREERAPGTARETVRGLSLSSDLLEFRPAPSSQSVRAEATGSPLFTAHSCSGDNMQTCFVHKNTAKNEGTCAANMGVRERVHPFSPPVSPQTIHPTGELRLKGDGGVRPPQASTINAELRVIDLCNEEETVVHEPQQAKSSREGFRSRLRAPRAGRALALASTNAKGNPVRLHERSPILSGDLPSKSLAPPPPILTQSAHRKEAWKEGRGDEEPQRSGREQCDDEPEFLISEASSGETDIDSNESGTVGYGAAVISTKELRDRNGRIERPCSKSEGTETQKSGASVYSDHELPRTEFPRKCDDERSRRSSVATSSNGSIVSQRKLNDEHPDTEISTCQRTRRFIDGAGCIPMEAATHAHLPRLRSCRPLEASNCNEQGDSRQHVSRDERVSHSQTGALAMPAKSESEGASRGGLYLDEDGGTEDTESMSHRNNGVVDDSSKARDQEAFVWFGQPDTPPTRQSNESRDTRAVPRADVPQQDGQTSSHRQQLLKARLLLQMEVRRQRNIIEHAFQQREEEGRLRRARLGAEVLKGIRALRASCNPSARAPRPLISSRTHPPSREPVPLTHAGVVEHALEKAHGVAENEREAEHLRRNTHGASDNELEEECMMGKAHRIAENGRQAEHLLGGTHGVAQNARDPKHLPRKTHDVAEDARLDHPERSIKAWGFGPVDHRANVVKETSSELALDNGAPVEASSRGSSIAPVPTRPMEPLPRSGANNPWGQVGRQVQQEGTKTTRAPTPPSISFDVAMDDVSGERVGLSGGTSEEQARRQERYKALRTRKLAEAEERRQGQKARQAAARETQRRKAAAAADNAGERRIQDVKQEARRLSSMKQETLTSGVISTPIEEATGLPLTRPRLSSARKVDHDNSNHKDRSPADIDRREAAWGAGVGARTPTSGPVHIASPAIRSFSRRSNRKLVRNAINFLCLAGGHLQEKKTRALEALDAHPASNFVILLTHTKLLAFKGLYACSAGEDDTAERVFGLGPPQVDAAMVSGFYKYNSAAREFREVHSKTLGKTTDAVSVEPARLRRTKGLAAHPAP